MDTPVESKKQPLTTVTEEMFEANVPERLRDPSKDHFYVCYNFHDSNSAFPQ